MGKYTGILLCSDFDGTLYNGVCIPERNMKAIKYFRENGGLFTLASGRDPHFLEPLFEGYSFGVPMININGAVIYDFDRKKIISERFLSGITMDKLDTIIHEVEGVCRISFFQKDGLKIVDAEKGEKVPSELLTGLYKFAVRISGDKKNGDRAKQSIKEIMTEHCVVRSSSNYVEILDPASTKAPNTRALARAVGADTLVCVGDYENDIEMIKGADIGYAVANAADEVKAVADRITVSVSDGAIAEIIEEL